MAITGNELTKQQKNEALAQKTLLEKQKFLGVFDWFMRTNRPVTSYTKIVLCYEALKKVLFDDIDEIPIGYSAQLIPDYFQSDLAWKVADKSLDWESSQIAWKAFKDTCKNVQQCLAGFFLETFISKINVALSHMPTQAQICYFTLRNALIGSISDKCIDDVREYFQMTLERNFQKNSRAKFTGTKNFTGDTEKALELASLESAGNAAFFPSTIVTAMRTFDECCYALNLKPKSVDLAFEIKETHEKGEIKVKQEVDSRKFLARFEEKIYAKALAQVHKHHQEPGMTMFFILKRESKLFYCLLREEIEKYTFLSPVIIATAKESFFSKVDSNRFSTFSVLAKEAFTECCQEFGVKLLTAPKLIITIEKPNTAAISKTKEPQILIMPSAKEQQAHTVPQTPVQQTLVLPPVKKQQTLTMPQAKEHPLVFRHNLSQQQTGKNTPSSSNPNLKPPAHKARVPKKKK